MEKYNPYVPFFVGLPLEMAGFLILHWIPEKKSKKTVLNEEPASNQLLEPLDRASSLKGLSSWFQSYITKFVKSVFQYPALLVAFLAFMVNKLSRQIQELLVQYLSLRFGWTMAQVSSGNLARTHFQPTTLQDAELIPNLFK